MRKYLFYFLLVFISSSFLFSCYNHRKHRNYDCSDEYSLWGELEEYSIQNKRDLKQFKKLIFEIKKYSKDCDEHSENYHHILDSLYMVREKEFLETGKVISNY